MKCARHHDGLRLGYGNVEIRNYLRYQAGSRSLVFDLSVTHERFGSSSHPQQNELLTLRRTPMRLYVLLPSARSIIIRNSTLTIRTLLFSPPLSAPAHACTANFCVSFFYRPTGRPRRTSLPLACHRNATNRTRSGANARHSASRSRAKSDSRRPKRRR